MSKQPQPPSLVRGEKPTVVPPESAEAKLIAMREAMSDPLFLADLQEVAEDFQSVQM